MEQSVGTIYLSHILQEAFSPTPPPHTHTPLILLLLLALNFFFFIHYHHSTALNFFFTLNSRAQERAGREVTLLVAG